MATAELVIDAAVARAETFSELAADATAAIGNAGRKVYINPYPLNVDKSSFDARLVRPDADTTPMPVYDAPTTPYPVTPTLVDLNTIDIPVFAEAPVISTAGLFTQTVPSSVMPDWNEANPALHVDEIYDELANLAAPVLADVDLPEISPLTLPTMPGFDLPSYEVIAAPEAIPASQDYATYLDTKYNAMLPDVQAYIDDTVDRWIAKFAPEFQEQRGLLHAKLVSGLEGGVLPDQFENAMYVRAQSRAEQEFRAAEETILNNPEVRGFLIPPAAVTSGLNKARLAAAGSLATQSTEIYIERRKSEIQHLQFVMSAIAQQVQSVRGTIVQLTQTAIESMRQAFSMADGITNKLIVRFEHERSRHEFSLAIMKALNEQYEVQLKAALSGLEAYKLELQALELQKNVEIKVLDAAKVKVDIQQLLVTRYSAMVDAIAKRAIVDELKIKEYGIRADVFKTNVQARLAAFEAYKAAIDGDKAKLQGELAKLEVYNSQIKAQELKLEAETKILDADVKVNAARLSQFTGQLDAYKVASQVALQKFTAGAEIKKMGLDIYKTNLQANIAAYEGELKLDLAWVETQIAAFKANSDKWIATMQLEQKYADQDIQKAIAIASSYSNIAASSASAAQGFANIAATE